MGNRPATTLVGQDSLNKKIRLRVGRKFLRLKCGEQPHLIDHIKEAVPDDSFTFLLQQFAPEDDDTDGNVEILITSKLKAVRCGMEYYLCAERNYHERRCPIRVSFEKNKQDASSTWILKRIPGDRYIMESYKFQNYCLASADGRLCIQRISRARRNKQLTFYPISKEQYIHR